MAAKHYGTLNFLKSTFEYPEKSIFHRFTDLFLWPLHQLSSNYDINIHESKIVKYRTPSTMRKILAVLSFPAVMIGIPLRYVSYYLSPTLRAQGPQIIDDFDEKTSQMVKLKKDIRELFKDRASNPLTLEAYRKRNAKLHKKYLELFPRLSSKNAWKDPSLQSDFEKLFKDACHLMIRFFPLVEESAKKENQLDTITPKAMAKEIVKQPFADGKPWAYMFFGLFMDLYYLARAKSVLIQDEDNEDVWHYARNRPELYSLPEYKDCGKHEVAPEYYQLGTKEYQWRKVYNTLYKEFYRTYGGQPFWQALQKADQRFTRWTKTDSSREEEFSVRPDTRPT